MLRAVRSFSAGSAARGGAHHAQEHAAAGQDYSVANDFSGTLWRNFFVGSLALFGLYKANQIYESQRDESLAHPITAYIAYHMKNNEFWAKKTEQAIQYAEYNAAKTLIMQELVDDKPIRMAAPELLERAAPWLISAGQRVDTSNLDIKN